MDGETDETTETTTKRYDVSPDGQSAKIQLKRPVTVQGQTYTSLTMREPTVRDQLAVSELKRAKMETTLLANLCDVPPDVIIALPISDYAQLQAAYRDFTV